MLPAYSRDGVGGSAALGCSWWQMCSTTKATKHTKIQS